MPCLLQRGSLKIIVSKLDLIVKTAILLITITAKLNKVLPNEKEY